MNHKPCPFCEAAIQTHTFAASQYCKAIYNLSPITWGHVLIIPTKHYVSIFDLSLSVYNDLMLFSKTVSEMLKSAYQSEGVNWSLQDGECAGQTVPHLHLHIIPRYPQDFPHPGDWYKRLKQNEWLDSEKRPKLTEEAIKKEVDLLRNLWNTH